jgi:uncharacterized protein YmfQ (DUF2313 family)
MSVEYAEQFQAHLPSGAAWPRAADSVSTELARGLTLEFGRVGERAAQLLLEMDPRTASELLPDWERITALPEPGPEGLPTTLEGRRAAVVARLLARGGDGPSVPFLTEVIAGLGYARDTITIRRFYRQAFTCESTCSDSTNEDELGWPYAWEIIVRHGAFDRWLQGQLKERYALAHLAVECAFPFFFFDDGTFSRAGAAVLINPETNERTALALDEVGRFYFGG